jgi:hypothetical protein
MSNGENWLALMIAGALPCLRRLDASLWSEGIAPIQHYATETIRHAATTMF